MTLRMLCVAVLLAVTAPPFASAQTASDGRWQNGVSEAAPFDPASCPPERVAAVKLRWEAIGDEARRSGDEWAGDYTVGTVPDVHMRILRWSPGAGFAALAVHNCEPVIVRVDYGKVDYSPGRLRLLPETPADAPIRGHGAHSGPAPADAYLPVRWGECHFLVAEREISRFYDMIAGSGDYRPRDFWIPPDEAFLLKLEDRDKEVSGMPVVPPGYERFEKRPVEAKIVDVGRSYVRRTDNPWWNDLVTEVRVDVGSSDGVARGTWFVAVDSDRYEAVEVTRAGRRTSAGRIVRSVRKRPGEKIDPSDDGEEIAYPPVRVGWRLSTNPMVHVERDAESIAHP